MHEETDLNLLKKTIVFQSCLIAGHSIEAIFRTECNYLLGESNANMIALCVYQKEQLKLEFILDKHSILHDFLKRYQIQSHTLVLDTLKEKSEKRIKSGEAYYETDSLQDLLIDSMPKHKIKYFEEMHKFTKMISYPLLSLEGKEVVGYLLFCYLDNAEPNMNALGKIQKMVERIVSPFHDEKTNTFRSRCIQVVSDVPVLTTKERHVLKHLLNAKSYAQIAEAMHISVNTVKTHIKNIYSKYDVKSKLELSNKISGGKA